MDNMIDAVCEDETNYEAIYEWNRSGTTYISSTFWCRNVIKYFLKEEFVWRNAVLLLKL